MRTFTAFVVLSFLFTLTVVVAADGSAVISALETNDISSAQDHEQFDNSSLNDEVALSAAEAVSIEAAEVTAVNIIASKNDNQSSVVTTDKTSDSSSNTKTEIVPKTTDNISTKNSDNSAKPNANKVTDNITRFDNISTKIVADNSTQSNRNKIIDNTTRSESTSTDTVIKKQDDIALLPNPKTDDKGEAIFAPTKLYIEYDNIGDGHLKLSASPNEFVFTLKSTFDEGIIYTADFVGNDAEYFVLLDDDGVADNSSLLNCLTSSLATGPKRFKKDEVCKINIAFGGSQIKMDNLTAGEKKVSLIVSYIGNQNKAFEFRFKGDVIRTTDIFYRANDEGSDDQDYATLVNTFADTIVKEQSSAPYIWIDSHDINIVEYEESKKDITYKLSLEDGFFDSFLIDEKNTTCKIGKNYQLELSKEPCYIFIYFKPKAEGRVSKRFEVLSIDKDGKTKEIITSEILSGIGI